MKEAKFRYKCRLCGEFEDNPCTSVPNADIHLYAIVYQGTNMVDMQKDQIGLPPTAIDIHNCKDGNTGIMDLLGFIIVDVL